MGVNLNTLKKGDVVSFRNGGVEAVTKGEAFLELIGLPIVLFWDDLETGKFRDESESGLDVVGVTHVKQKRRLFEGFINVYENHFGNACRPNFHHAGSHLRNDALKGVVQLIVDGDEVHAKYVKV